MADRLMNDLIERIKYIVFGTTNFASSRIRAPLVAGKPDRTHLATVAR
ncbi:hypothetical protein [Ferrimicrobium sp.]|nr:hypothetical protein [Ferrimicrobium sp.]